MGVELPVDVALRMGRGTRTPFVPQGRATPTKGRQDGQPTNSSESRHLPLSVLFELAVECLTIQFEDPRGEGLVAVHGGQDM